MNKNFPQTCVAPTGEFVYGIHKPKYTAPNLRQNDYIVNLGHGPDHTKIDNADNFPADNIHVASSAWVFEIPNAFPFMGATFVLKTSADGAAGNANPFERKDEGGPARSLEKYEPTGDLSLENLPRSLLLALAKTSSDPQILIKLANLSCRFEFDPKIDLPMGISYAKTERGNLRPAILDEQLFDLVSNNPFLPDTYKQRMVLIPGVQGKSPIVGEYIGAGTHIWEYLRENSYIPWGHYAANTAHDSIRYKIGTLTEQDIIGLRHLYYQRIYVQLAIELDIIVPAKRRPLSRDELEDLRHCLLVKIRKTEKQGGKLPFNATIWGQNFGFDLSPSGYRLNASHQQIHQQFALVPPCLPAFKGGENETSQCSFSTYTQGDLVARFCEEYKGKTGRGFFETYLHAIQNNKRMDGRTDKENDLIFYQDENVLAFVPKAQRSQGEVQIMPRGRYGNILETDTPVRSSLDRAILIAMKVLENLGAEMITLYEISKRFDHPDKDQRLIYCLLPKHPQSPGGLSEGMQRWIIGHYPEDFALACRDEVKKII